MTPKAILFVCLGNICRSPMAETVFKKQIFEQKIHPFFDVDSAGLINYHEGNQADSRMRFFADKRGYHITHKSRPVRLEDFDRFDLIVCMDKQNFRGLYHLAQTPEQKDKIRYMTDFSELYAGQEVPDPYYGGDQGFNFVIDMLEESCRGLINYLTNK